MKNKLFNLVLMLIIILPVNSFAQYKSFLDSTNEWDVTAGGLYVKSGYYNNHIIKINGDTIIDSIQYKQLWTQREEPNSIFSDHYIGGIREDSSHAKIYFRHKGESEELLYDFNIQIGDTFLIRKVDPSNCTIYVNMTVDSIDTIYLHTLPYKRIMFDSLPWVYRDIWIEGIGSLSGIVTLENVNDFPTPDEILLCFHQNDSLIFKNSYFQNPYYDGNCKFVYVDPTNINDSKEEQKILVTPNPAKDFINLRTYLNLVGDFKIEFINELGIIALSQNIINSSTLIDISVLPQGLYFIRISGKGISYFSKLIKN